MSSHGQTPPSSNALKRWPMSLQPNMVTWLFTARSEQAEGLGIDPVEPAQRLVQAREHVGRVAAAPVSDHRPGEPLAIALAAPGIGIEDGVAGAGLHLELVEERVAVLGVGSAVD